MVDYEPCLCAMYVVNIMTESPILNVITCSIYNNILMCMRQGTTQFCLVN